MEKNDFQYNIRIATEHDAEAIVAMIKELALYEDMLDQCHLTPEVFRKDGFGINPVFQSLIAEVKSGSSDAAEPIGYGLFYYIYSTFKGKNVYLEDLYVKEKYRKHGIGGNLMKMVAKIALENGCVQYRFACLGWNKNALNFYKSIGARDLTEIEDWHMMRFEKSEMDSLAKQISE